MSTRPLAFERGGARGADVLVLLHPICANRAIWSAQAAVLSQYFEVLSLDLPGHGDSPLDCEASLSAYAQAVLGTLDSVGIERAAFVGLSLGGMVAQALALQAGARVTALVLANTTGQSGPPARSLWQQRVAQAERDGMESQVAATIGRWFTESFRAAAPLTMAWIAAMVRDTPLEGYRSAAQAICGLDHLQALNGISTPTLVVSGDADAAVTPAQSQALATAIPTARHLVLRGAPHISSIEQSTPITELVGRFLLDSVPPNAQPAD